MSRAVDAGQEIVAVEVHSAPSGEGGEADALSRSLAEAAGWGWRGAALVLEHCDSYHADRRGVKEFLPLEEELDAVATVAAQGAATPVGVTINWGRSAIDARNADGPVEQIGLAKSRGLLAGLMLSGASDRHSVYGPPWDDTHAPGAAIDTSAGEPASLLTSERILAARDAAGAGLRYDGVKLSARPDSVSSVRRVAYIARVLSSLV